MYTVVTEEIPYEKRKQAYLLFEKKALPTIHEFGARYAKNMIKVEHEFMHRYHKDADFPALLAWFRRVAMVSAYESSGPYLWHVADEPRRVGLNLSNEVSPRYFYAETFSSIAGLLKSKSRTVKELFPDTPDSTFELIQDCLVEAIATLEANADELMSRKFEGGDNEP